MERVWKRVQSAGRRGATGRCGCPTQPCQLHVDQRAKRGASGAKKSRGPQTIVCACQVQPCPVHPVLIRVRRTRPFNDCDCPADSQPCPHAAPRPSASRRVRRCDCPERPCRHSTSGVVSRRRPQGSFSLPSSSNLATSAHAHLARQNNNGLNNCKALCECPEGSGVCPHACSDGACDCEAKPCSHTVKPSRRSRKTCQCTVQPCLHTKNNEGRIKRVKYRVRRAGCAMARCTAELAMLKLHWELATECAPCKPRAFTRRLCRRQQSDNELYRSNSFKFERFERTKDDCPSPSRNPVALEEDGTEVDDDEILLELSKMSLTPICLMLIPENGTWQSATESSKTLLEAKPSTSTANERSINESPVALGESVGSNIWSKFPERLMKSCQNGQRAYEVDRRAMVATIADHMIHHLKDYSRSTAERMAKMITEKYPKTFSDVISDKVVGSGMETLRQQIYNAVNYRKFDKEAKKRVEFGLNDKDDDDVSEPVEPPRKQDEYGCVEYQPLLPSTETAQSQTDKKNALIKFFEAKEKDDEKITNLMNDTYPTQRMTINKKKRTLTQVFQDWPYLKTPQYIEKHASRLLGKPICKTWEEYLPKIAKSLRKYTIYTEKSQLLKAKKSTSHKEGNEKSSDVLNLIAEARASSAATKSDISIMALAFPLIAIQLKEDLQLLCKVVSEDVLATEIVDEVDADFPILIIRGKSLFDNEAKCDVIIEGNSISARDVLDGMLVTFLAYYVFGYEYRPGITKTLEFIQRALLQINPQTGHKQKGNRKKKTMSFDANVMKLASSLQAFEDD